MGSEHFFQIKRSRISHPSLTVRSMYSSPRCLAVNERGRLVPSSHEGVGITTLPAQVVRKRTSRILLLMLLRLQALGQELRVPPPEHLPRKAHRPRPRRLGLKGADLRFELLHGRHQALHRLFRKEYAGL